jgi:hypothetical protein
MGLSISGLGEGFAELNLLISERIGDNEDDRRQRGTWMTLLINRMPGKKVVPPC